MCARQIGKTSSAAGDRDLIRKMMQPHRALRQPAPVMDRHTTLLLTPALVKAGVGKPHSLVLGELCIIVTVCE